MRILFVIVAVLVLQSLSAQVLVPYRLVNKYGLSDEKGKIIVKPAYDEISYLKADYFQYNNFNISYDSIHFTNGTVKLEQKMHRVFGLYFKNKLIISNQPYKHFLVYKHCIIGSQNPYHPENCTLFNLKGDQLINETVKGIGVNDERDFGNLVGFTQKFTLLAIYERDEYRNRIFSIAIYDNEKQQITNWLFKKVSNQKLIKTTSGSPFVFYKYQDAAGLHESCIRYSNDHFELIPNSELAIIELNKMKNSSRDFYNEPRVQMVEMGSESDAPVPTIVEASEIPNKLLKIKSNVDLSYYQITSDSLHYINDSVKLLVNLPKGLQLITVQKQASIQRESILYKQGNQYGLLSHGKIIETKFDSLVYFGNQFIAGKRIGGKFLFGSIDKEGKIIIPIIYDSIIGELKKLSLADYRLDNETKYRVVLKTNESGNTSLNNLFVKKISNIILVYKNGKAGILSNTNEVIIPIVYDLIAENGMSYYEAKESYFIILKQNSLYGLTSLEYERENKKTKMVHTIQPQYPFMPLFYLRDYYQVKGFRLFGLYDEGFIFKGYAHENGYLYFKD